MSKRSYVQDLIGIWQFCFSGLGGKLSYPQEKKIPSKREKRKGDLEPRLQQTANFRFKLRISQQ